MAITFVAAGTAAAANNGNVTPGLPVGIASGDLLIGMCRSNGVTGSPPSTPSGWTALTGFPYTGPSSTIGLNLVYKTATGSDTDPTFTFSGISGLTVIGQVCAFRGSSTPVIDVQSSVTDPNSNAQDIGAITALSGPAENCAVIVIGSKNDDWTSVDTLTGDSLTWNEIGEPDSTLGLDGGLVWDYAIASGVPTVTSKTFTVIGGAVNIWAGFMFSIVEPAASVPYLLVKN